jgi:choline-sulfatase
MSSRAPYIATLVALVALCCSALAQVGTSTHQRSVPARPNILFVTIDTVRADHLGCYGAKNASTPTMDALASSGIVFERAISQVPLTSPSHASMLTGTYPFHNGVQDFTGQPLSPEFGTVAEVFKRHGYATGAVVSSFVLDRSWGLARGFDHYDDAFAGTQFLTKDLGLVERRAEESVSHAIQWLSTPRAKPFFLWLHLYDPHSPYDPPEPFRSRFKDSLYDGEIAYADSELGRLITWLRRNGRYDNTAIVLTSDHGESLGEHGEKEHGLFVYQSTVHVPLIIKLPARARAAHATVTGPVELAALAPTLLNIAGLSDAIAKQFDTSSLLPIRAPKDDSVAYSETFYPFSSFGWSPLRALQSRSFQFIQAPRSELYDLTSDPIEAHNISADNNPMLAAMRVRLGQFKSSPRKEQSSSNTTLDPAAQSKLQALGYVGFRAPVAEADFARLADPKDKVAEFHNILAAADAFRAGRYEQGVQLLTEVQHTDPNMYLVPFMLGEAASSNKDWGTASAQFARALQLNPQFDEAMTALARALFEQGKTGEAKSWVEKALQQNAKNFRAWYELGWIQMRSEPDQAAEAFTRAINIQPNFALAHRDLGTLNYQKQQYEVAAHEFQAAADLGLRDPMLLNLLGISYSRTAKLTQAVNAYREALKLQPDMAQAHLNLGFAYQRLDRLEASRAEYRVACKLDQKLCSMVPK